MIVISGPEVAGHMETELKAEVVRLKGLGCVPTLAVIQAGDNPASLTYVNGKLKTAERLGIATRTVKLPETVTQAEVDAAVDRLNADPSVHGLLVQLPLPRGLDSRSVALRIDPRKDVDGFTPMNAGLLALGMPRFMPCTPAGVLELLAYYKIDVTGKTAVILGRSNIVGRPLSVMLSSLGWDATVVVCHSHTAHIEQMTRQADILIAAVGKPEYVKADMVKQGAVVIDVGINRVSDPSKPRGYRVTGDVDYAAVAPKCFAITPVPGGVGPMTVTLLMKNTLLAAKELHGKG
jgi:methylenetetrahydrofolate dehydrogenase (NADP+)/methenyltetrahydrofolate cyclohydrolase